MEHNTTCPKCGLPMVLISSGHDWGYICIKCGNVIKI